MAWRGANALAMADSSIQELPRTPLGAVQDVVCAGLCPQVATRQPGTRRHQSQAAAGMKSVSGQRRGDGARTM